MTWGGGISSWGYLISGYNMYRGYMSTPGGSIWGYMSSFLSYHLSKRVYSQFCIETLHERHNGIQRLVVCLSEIKKSKNELFEISYLLMYLCSF